MPAVGIGLPPLKSIVRLSSSPEPVIETPSTSEAMERTNTRAPFR
jgi:hypothetical protein